MVSSPISGTLMAALLYLGLGYVMEMSTLPVGRAQRCSLTGREDVYHQDQQSMDSTDTALPINTRLLPTWMGNTQCPALT